MAREWDFCMFLIGLGVHGFELSFLLRGDGGNSPIKKVPGVWLFMLGLD